MVCLPFLALTFSIVFLMNIHVRDDMAEFQLSGRLHFLWGGLNKVDGIVLEGKLPSSMVKAKANY